MLVTNIFIAAKHIHKTYLFFFFAEWKGVTFESFETIFVVDFDSDNNASTIGFKAFILL